MLQENTTLMTAWGPDGKSVVSFIPNPNIKLNHLQGNVPDISVEMSDKQLKPCPTCGAPMEGAPFIVDLDTNTIRIDGVSVALTAQMTEMAWALNETYPRPATKEYIFSVTHSLVSDIEIKIIDVQMHKFRKRISHTRLRVKTIWGKGYCFVLKDSSYPNLLNNVNFHDD